MTNTTDTYWSVNGQSLNTYAKNIVSLNGRMKPPPMRGDDVTIPYAIGQRFVRKIADSNTQSLGMWLRGANDDGTHTGNTNDQFDENWRALRTLLWNPGQQVTLTKRFKVAGIARSASAQVQFVGGLEPTMIGRNAAKFTVDLKMTSPYFYDDVVSTFSLALGDNSIYIPGDAETQNLQLVFNGVKTSPLVRVNAKNIQVQYFGALLNGDVATLDIPSYTAVTKPSGVPAYNSSGKVRHSGAPHWLALDPNTNIVNLSAADASTGTVQLIGRGAWI